MLYYIYYYSFFVNEFFVKKVVDLKIEQLRRAMEVSKTGSINRAAQNLYMSQSSLSSSIRALESEMGEDIFCRSQEGVSLTIFGQQFVEHAQAILRHYEKIEQISALAPHKMQPSRLDVMVYYLYFASQIWAQFCNNHKNENIDLNYIERTRSEIVTAVANGKAELGLVMMPSIDREKWLSLFTSQSIDYTCITIETPHAVVGPNCEFYNAKMLTPAQMTNRKMIIFPEENELFMMIDRKIFKQFSPSSYFTVCDRASLSGILHETGSYYLGTFNKKAYSCVPFYENIKSIPIIGIDFHYEIGLVKAQNHTLSDYAVEFLHMVQKIMV